MKTGKTLTRLLLSSVCMLLVFSMVLTGCQSSTPAPSIESFPTPPPENTAQAEDTNSPAGETVLSDGEYTLPLSEQPVSIKVATLDNFEPSASYTGEKLPIFIKIEEVTNVALEFEVYSSDDDYNNAMQTRLAAGSDLPDLIRLPGNDPMKFVPAGLILNMGELINQYAPNIKQLFEEYPEYSKPFICPDGNQYTIAKFMKAAPFNMPSIIMRGDWLTNLGLEEPKTIEDWDIVLEAFKTQDPNGNGQQDEIPICNFGSPFYGTDYFASSYGVNVMDNITYEKLALRVENGVVTSDWINNAEGAKQWLTKMNEWYVKGYFDAEMLTQNSEKWNSKILGNSAGTAFTYSLNEPQWDDQMRGTIPEVDWVNVAPPAGPAGNGYYYISNGQLYDWQFAITKGCKDPKLVTQFLDYIYANPEGKMYLTWGIEGEDYIINADGLPSYTDSINAHEKGSGYVIWARGIMANLPCIQPENHLPDRFGKYADTKVRMDEIGQYTLDAPIYGIPTEEENSALSGKLTSLRSYVEENIIKFILGKLPIEDYDKFAAELEKLGIQEVLDVKQAQYGRAN